MATPGDMQKSAFPGSVDLIYALNDIATALQQSIRNEENVYRIFQQQVVAIGMRGGISEYDEEKQILRFKTVAFTNPLRKLLNRFEKDLHTQAEGYNVAIDKVDVYRKVVVEGQSVFVADTSTVSAQVVPTQFRGIIQPLLGFLGRPAGIFTPLVYEGKIKGMLNMVGENLTEADVPTLRAFANQIAVALENARLVKKLQIANDALEMAYQRTLEGWVQALDLRDNETEGHTLRVADATVRLATFMGFSSDEMNSIRQGALLHDIGKMAVPDNILRKPGPLNDTEWQVMRQHPTTAYNWLKSIEYLQAALVIPHYHHEHWDGSGYGAGLSGEQIPLKTRVFTVVDVWDAMRSDRPYRKALSSQETLNYLCSNADKLFDRQVVEAFLNLLEKEPDLDADQRFHGRHPPDYQQ